MQRVSKHKTWNFQLKINLLHRPDVYIKSIYRFFNNTYCIKSLLLIFKNYFSPIIYLLDTSVKILSDYID